MIHQQPIMLFIEDEPVLSSLQFSLLIEGLQAICGTAEGADLSAVLVIDQSYRGDGLTFLRDLRGRGENAPAILLATNPGVALRAKATALGAQLIEKPLLGDELSHAIRGLLKTWKAA